MTTRRSPPPTSRARGKKKKVKKKTPSQVAAAKKKAANKKAHAKKASSKKKNKAPGTKKPARAAKRSVRRKPQAPDMSMHVRSVKDLDDKQIVEAKLTIIRVISMKGNVREATDAAGVHRTQAYEWRSKDETFREAWDDGLEEAADRLEEAAWLRAVEGTDHPVIYQGEITDTYKEYSDSLLTTLLKGNRASKYKERTEHSTPPGQPLQLEAETKVDVISSILGMIHSKPDPD